MVSKFVCGPGTSFTQPAFKGHLPCAGPRSGHRDRGIRTGLPPTSLQWGDERVKGRPDPAWGKSLKERLPGMGDSEAKARWPES